MQTVEIVLPVYCWSSLTPVNLPLGGVNRLLDMQGLRRRGSCVIKR